MISLSITARFILATVLPALFLSLIAVTIYLQNQVDITYKNENEKLSAVANSVAIAVEFALVTKNVEQLRDITRATEGLQSIVEFRVYDTEDLLFSRKHEEVDQNSNQRLPPVLSRYFFRNQPQTYLLTAPVMLTDMSFVEDTLYDVPNNSQLLISESQLGRVEFMVNMEPVFLQQNVWIAKVINYGFFMVFLFCLFGFYFARTIASPIVEITNAITELSRGENRTIDKWKTEKFNRDGELGRLAMGIDRLASQLGENERIQEARINQATVDLKRAVSNLQTTNIELDEAKDKANSANALKTRFLANMSHEIRTPMNSIVGNLSLLSDSNIDSEQKKFLNAIHISSNSMLKLIDEILDISAIESDNLAIVPRRVDLSNLLVDLHASLLSLALEKNLELLVYHTLKSHQCLVQADQQKLEQVLTNLLANAIKFTAEGYVICLLEYDDQKECYTFSVIDTGIGIPEEEQSHIFDAFYQADMNTTRAYHGNGLGLHISAAIIESMGGVLELHSQLNKGTTMIVQLEFESIEVSAEQFADSVAVNKIPVCFRALDSRMHGHVACYLNSSGFELHHPLSPTLTESADTHFLIHLPVPVTQAKIQSITDSLTSNTMTSVVLVDHLDEAQRKCLHSSGVDKIVHKTPNTRLLSNEILSCAETYTMTEIDQQSELKVESRAEIQKSKSLQVLVLDDNPVNLDLMENYLSKLGHAFQLFETSDAALQQLARHRFDCIFLDLHVPFIDGFEIVAQIRGDGGINKHSFFIALSADVYESTKQNAMTCGFDRFMEKPITLNDIEKLLHSVADKGLKVAESTEFSAPELEHWAPVDTSNYINVESLKSMLSIDTEVAIALLKRFEQSLLDQSEDIRQAMLNDDEKTLFELLHSIKGAASICSVGKLVESISRIELESQSVEWESTTHNVEQLLLEMEKVTTECRLL